MKDIEDKIFFSKDIPNLIEKKFNSDFGKDTLVVYHAMYGKPDVGSMDIVEWEKYKGIHSNYDPSRIVVIGLNRMKTPSNRCDFIHAYLSVMTTHIPKISIDISPFIGEPWRLFYHYQIVNDFGKFGANYSYPIEGEWFRWFQRNEPECQFTPNILKSRIVNTCYDLPKHTSTFDFYVPEDSDIEWYEEVKKFELNRYRAPKSLLSNLVRSANKHFGVKVKYDSYLEDKRVSVPDIGIYRFVVEECIRRQNIYNLFAI